MIVKYSVHLQPLVEEVYLRRARDVLGFDDLQIWRDYYFEVPGPVAAEAEERLREALGDPRTEEVRAGRPLEQGRMVQVAYLRGIVDNENDSLVALCGLLGIEARAAKVATTYVSAHAELARRVRRHFCNASIEELHEREPDYDTLRPHGESQPPRRYDLRGLDDAGLLAVGAEGGRNLDLDKMRTLKRIQERLGAEDVTDTLVEAVDARWSDHCMHTTWKSLGGLLGRLADASRRTGNANIVSMFEDNAGVWDFYDGWAIAVKAETHSGPSAISAYFGQLTKVGGVLRDILGTGLGADPVGIFEYTATGPVDAPSPFPERPSPKQIAHETIRAVKEYGNTFGVPMMQAQMSFHERYRAKPFALGGAIGMIPRAAAGRRTPQAGDVLMLIGGLTGNDGIHGASASSAGSEMDEASVQIGSPLEQIKFRQAILDMRDAGCLRALTDVGGAGLNSAAGEIGDPTGVWLNTALVPLKTSALPSWRILLSESQERMILAVIPERLARARDILERHAVRHATIGRFTGDARYTVVHDEGVSEADVVAADPLALPGLPTSGFSVPYELLDYEPPPLPSKPVRTPAEPDTAWPELDAGALRATLTRVLADAEVASQRWASAQYDSTVQGHTLYGPTAGAAHVPTSYWATRPLAAHPGAVVFSTAFDPWLFELDPLRATRQMFLRALGGQVLAGVAPADVCLCDNFYTPHLQEDGNDWLVAMVDELCALVELTGAPLISGKDSSAGSVVTPEGVVSVPPAVFLSAVGKVADRARLRRNEWREPGSVLVRIGPDTASPAGTVAGALLGLKETSLDWPSAQEYVDYLRALTGTGPEILSARPVGRGGVLACLALGTLASAGIGVELVSQGDEGALLAEHRCGAVVEVVEASLESLPAALRPRIVGRLTSTPQSLRLAGEELLEPAAIRAWSESWAGMLR